MRALITVAEITTSRRGIAAEVPLDITETGIDHESAVNCDVLHTVPKTMLIEQVGAISGKTMQQVCLAAAHAIGC